MFQPFAALALSLLILGSQAHSKSPLTNSETVSIVVKDPSGSVNYDGLLWTTDTTVLSAMQSADGLEFSGDWYRSFNDWLIISINGVDSQGSGKENWNFCVNGTPAQVGVSAYRLPPNAQVQWVYTATYPPTC